MSGWASITKWGRVQVETEALSNPSETTTLCGDKLGPAWAVGPEDRSSIETEIPNHLEIKSIEPRPTLCCIDAVSLSSYFLKCRLLILLLAHPMSTAGIWGTLQAILPSTSYLEFPPGKSLHAMRETIYPILYNLSSILYPLYSILYNIHTRYSIIY